MCHWVEPSCMGLAASERVPRELPGTSHPVRTWREGALTRHKTFWYLLASRTLRNKCCVSHARSLWDSVTEAPTNADTELKITL